MSQRYFSSIAIPNSVGNSGGLSSFGTSLTLSSIPSGFPAQTPFTLRIDPNTSLEELVEVESGSGTSSSPYVITRGIDGTTAKAHNQYATVSHGLSARDLQEPNNHIQDNGNHSAVSPNPHNLDNSVWTSTAAWTSYTPIWSATGTAPGLGNAILAGSYAQLGKTVFFRLSFTIGSTSTLGSGFWTFSVPVNFNTSNQIQTGTALAQPPSGNFFGMWANTPSASSVYVYSTSNSAAWGPSAPASWSAGYGIVLSGTYNSV